MKSTRIGTASTTKVRDLPPEIFISAELARKNPMNIDPLSPMKIDAGFEL